MPLDVDDVMQATKFQVRVPTRLGDGIFILLSSCEFQLSEFEWDSCASMASKQTKPWNTTEETVELALDSDLGLIRPQNLEICLHQKEEMLDAGCDLVVESEEPRYTAKIVPYFLHIYP